MVVPVVLGGYILSDPMGVNCATGGLRPSDMKATKSAVWIVSAMPTWGQPASKTRFSGGSPPEYPLSASGRGSMSILDPIRDMGLAGIVHERRDEILRAAARHGAGNIRLFGSAA